MTKWEYRSVNTKDRPGDEPWQDYMNILGAEGWELVSMEIFQERKPFAALTFKRPLADVTKGE